MQTKLKDPKAGDLFVTSMYIDLMVGRIISVDKESDDKYLRYGSIEVFDGKQKKVIPEASLGYLNDPDLHISRNLKEIGDMQNKIADLLHENEKIERMISNLLAE